MSTPGDKHPLGGAIYVDKLLAEDEARRIEGLSEAELAAEMVDAGATSPVPTTEELLERVKARAAGRKKLARGPSGTASAVAPGIRRRPAAPAPARRRVSARTVVLLLAAAFAIVLLATWGGAGRAIARWLRPADDTIGPDTPSPEWLAMERARKRARELREAGHVDCADRQWKACLGQLDEAKGLDPEGDEEPAVREDRRAATEALAAPIEVPKDPKVPGGPKR